VRWLISRFSAADRPGWTAPADDELRQHVDDRFLAVVPDLVAQLSRAAADLRTDLVVIGQAPLEAQVQLAGVRYVAAVDARPPYRLLGLQGFPLADGAFAELGARPGPVPAGPAGLAGRRPAGRVPAHYPP
jgi:hypothetical protein